MIVALLVKSPLKREDVAIFEEIYGDSNISQLFDSSQMQTEHI